MEFMSLDDGTYLRFIENVADVATTFTTYFPRLGTFDDFAVEGVDWGIRHHYDLESNFWWDIYLDAVDSEYFYEYVIKGCRLYITLVYDGSVVEITFQLGGSTLTIPQYVLDNAVEVK